MADVDSVNSNQIELNKRLFKAVAQNLTLDICLLIDKGANVNSEFTLDELVNNKLIDDNAINIINNAKISVHSLPARRIFTHQNIIGVIQNSYKEVIFLPGAMSEIFLSSNSKLSTLQLAVLCGSKQAIILLIKEGSNPNKALDTQGLTILQLMCTAAIFKDSPCYLFNEDIIQLLFDYGADPNIRDVTGKAFLHYAVISGDFLTDELKRSVTRLSAKTPDFLRSHFRRIENILINGANPNIVDNIYRCTILYFVVQYLKHRNTGLIKLLLDHRGICNTYEEKVLEIPYLVRLVEKKYGITYSTTYTKNLHKKFNSKHKEYIEKNSQLINAIKRREKSQVSVLLNENISPNIRDNDGNSALHLAVKLGEYDIVDLLLYKGANPNIKSWRIGTTPLFYAATSNRIDIGKLLLKYKANPNVKNTKGLSPLYFNVTNNNVEMTELLLKYKANPDVSFQISLLLHDVIGLNEVSDMEVVEITLKNVKSLAIFLKSRKCQILKHSLLLFHDARNIAEKNNKKNIAKQISDLLDELFSDVSKI